MIDSLSEGAKLALIFALKKELIKSSQIPLTVSRKGSIYKEKLPGYDIYFFEKYIPLGIQKKPNENIRCVA